MNQSLTKLAAKFSDFHNANLTKGQRTMIEDGLPAALALTAEQRRAARNLNTAITTMTTETAQRLNKPETEEMKKMRAAAAKAATKRTIHIPRKAKKASKPTAARATKTLNKSQADGAAAARSKIIATNQAKAGGEKIGRKDQVIGMMTAPGGTTVEAICAATGILAHSARALISGIAKVQPVTTSKETGAKTVYSIK